MYRETPEPPDWTVGSVVGLILIILIIVGATWASQGYLRPWLDWLLLF